MTSKLHQGKISIGSSTVAPTANVSLTRNMLDLSPLSSVTASYQNVDFLAVPEPYKIIQSMSLLHNPSHKRSGSMVHMIDQRPGSLLENQSPKQSGIMISHGKTFLNEPKRRFMYRMSSCPSRAHEEAMQMFEKHNKALM